jgi:hypothetical protein
MTCFMAQEHSLLSRSPSRHGIIHPAEHARFSSFLDNGERPRTQNALSRHPKLEVESK